MREGLNRRSFATKEQKARGESLTELLFAN
jgi:hypothetical protein